jgi:hypothetical protein
MQVRREDFAVPSSSASDADSETPKQDPTQEYFMDVDLDVVCNAQGKSSNGGNGKHKYTVYAASFLGYGANAGTKCVLLNLLR